MSSFLQNIDKLKYKKYIKYKFKYLTLKKQIGGGKVDANRALEIHDEMSKAKDKAKSYLSDSQKIVGTSLGQYIKSQDNLTDEFVNDFLSYLKFVGWNDLAKWIKIIFSNITTSIEGPDISHISGNDNKTRVINAIIDRYNFTKRQMCKKLKKSGGLIHKDHNC
jgi:hypothetical protein